MGHKPHSQDGPTQPLRHLRGHPFGTMPWSRVLPSRRLVQSQAGSGAVPRMYPRPGGLAVLPTAAKREGDPQLLERRWKGRAFHFVPRLHLHLYRRLSRVLRNQTSRCLPSTLILDRPSTLLHELHLRRPHRWRLYPSIRDSPQSRRNGRRDPASPFKSRREPAALCDWPHLRIKLHRW
jgi:hypothetical protein